MSETPRTASHHFTLPQGTISFPSRPLSRRALIKAAGIAPLIVLGRRAWAQPTPENMADFAMIAPVPATELAWAKSQAATDVPGVDPNKFELVARALWAHFHYGLGKVGVESQLELLKLMYNDPVTGTVTKTGARVADNIKKGSFDPLGNDYQTNVCAYICGHKAATAALSQGKTKIDEAMYKAARAATQQEMTQKLSVARSLAMGGRGPSSELGYGC